MNITRYGQSCILIETNNKRILVDPGYLKYDVSLLTKGWHNIDIILITHKHRDHCFEEAIKEILKNPKTKIYASKEVCDAYPNLQPIKVSQGQTIKEGNINIEVVNAVHGYIPYLKGELEIHENVGFIIDDSNTRCYITSDSICFKNNYKCDVLCVPVSNHGLVMGIFEAAVFAKETGCNLVIPTHYDNPKFPVDLKEFKRVFNEKELPFKILDLGESIKI